MLNEHLKTELRKLAEDNGGRLPAFAWPGGYPLFYIDGQGSVLCPECAQKSAADPEEFADFLPAAADVNHEDIWLSCDNCSRPINPGCYTEAEAEAMRRAEDHAEAVQ